MADAGGEEDTTGLSDGSSEVPEPVDPFDNLVLDDDFVKGAARSEPSARHRAPTRLPMAGSEGPSRRDRRRARRVPTNGQRYRSAKLWLRQHPKTTVGTLILLLLVALVTADRGPISPGSGFLQATGIAARPGAQAHSPPSAVRTQSDASTHTTIAIANRNYQPGDCVTWDQNPGHAVGSSVVPCSAPHLIEITHDEQLTSYVKGAPIPDALQWRQIFLSVCGPVAASYLGYALDPTGRFVPGGMNPSDRSWVQDDRTLWCGIGMRAKQDADSNPNNLDPFTGVVRGQDQGSYYVVGSCLGSGTQGLVGAIVPCTSPHVEEVTGAVNIAGGVDHLPQSNSEWNSLVGTGCQNVAIQYHGGGLPPGVLAGWFSLTQTDWDAGVRTVQCSIGWYDTSGNPAIGTSVLRG